jgi:hypothetical protein
MKWWPGALAAVRLMPMKDCAVVYSRFSGRASVLLGLLTDESLLNCLFAGKAVPKWRSDGLFCLLLPAQLVQAAFVPESGFSGVEGCHEAVANHCRISVDHR